jgi:hypothetical protein
MQERQQRMMDALNVRREGGIDWRALLLPALGLAWVTFFLGEAPDLPTGMQIYFAGFAWLVFSGSCRSMHHRMEPGCSQLLCMLALCCCSMLWKP